MSNTNMENVDTDLMVETFSSMSKLNIDSACLTKSQLQALIPLLVRSKTLKELLFSHMDTEFVKLQSNSKELQIEMTQPLYLSPNICIQTIILNLKAIISSEKLVQIKFCGVDLMQVPDKLLGSVISNLRNLRLLNCMTSSRQLCSVFSSIEHSQSIREVEV